MKDFVSLPGPFRIWERKGSKIGTEVMVTGTDVARTENGRIKTLHVFLDPPIG